MPLRAHRLSAIRSGITIMVRDDAPLLYKRVDAWPARRRERFLASSFEDSTIGADREKGGMKMSKKAFDKIVAGLTEALEIARGNAKPAKLFVPPGMDVRAIRHKLDLSQEQMLLGLEEVEQVQR
jgi:hypothetical protein